MCCIFHNLNFYKYRNVSSNTKRDYSKIWKLAQYDPSIGLRGVFSTPNKQKQCLLDHLSKHREFNALYDSLSEEAREELKPRMDDLNKKFKDNVEFYRERFNIPNIN